MKNKYRVIKKVYSDGKHWFFLQEKTWAWGKWHDLEPHAWRPDYDGLWIGFKSEEDAVKKCMELNVPSQNPIVTIVYPNPIPDFKLIPKAPPPPVK